MSSTIRFRCTTCNKIVHTLDDEQPKCLNCGPAAYFLGVPDHADLVSVAEVEPVFSAAYDFKTIAAIYRYLSVAIAFKWLLLIAWSALAVLSVEVDWLPAAVCVAVLFQTAIAVTLAAKLHNNAVGALVAGLLLIPVVDLVTAIFLNKKSKEVLRKNGIDVGLFGARGWMPTQKPRRDGAVPLAAALTFLCLFLMFGVRYFLEERAREQLAIAARIPEEKWKIETRRVTDFNNVNQLSRPDPPPAPTNNYPLNSYSPNNNDNRKPAPFTSIVRPQTPVDNGSSYELPAEGAAPRSLFAPVPEGDKTKAIGFGLDPDYDDPGPAGATLVGFDIGLGKFEGKEVVNYLRPNYLVDGAPAVGGARGRDFKRAVNVVARAGYAVGALTIRPGLGIDSLRITFMRINGKTLNPADSYESAWFGESDSPKFTVSGMGRPASGIRIKLNTKKELTGVGLLLQPGRK